MSFHVFFAFSNGLTKSLRAPKGTLTSILDHVDRVEKTLGLHVVQPSHPADMPHWDHWSPNWRKGFAGVEDKVLCETVERHNSWVLWIYRRFEEWAKAPVKGGELLKPADARKFWAGLQTLKVDPSRWTPDFYRARMEELYEALRGRDAAGMTFDAKPLTPRQAASVFNLFDQYLDVGDLRLDVPKGRDHLLPSGAHEGGYEWCERCGAVEYDDGMQCRKRKCPIIEQFGEKETAP